MAEHLYRSRDDRMVAGVAGGVAEQLDADPSLIRIVWAVLIFLSGGLALLVYIVMAIVVPERPEGTAPAATDGPMVAADGSTAAPAPVPVGSWRAPDGSTVPMGASTALTGQGARATSTQPVGRRRDPADRTRGGLIAGLVLIGLGSIFLVRQFVPAIDLGFWWPTLAVGLGILLVVIALLPSRRSG